jgi:hypothetical protein
MLAMGILAVAVVVLLLALAALVALSLLVLAVILIIGCLIFSAKVALKPNQDTHTPSTK